MLGRELSHVPDLVINDDPTVVGRVVRRYLRTGEEGGSRFRHF